jgi:hypothetical protein
MTGVPHVTSHRHTCLVSGGPFGHTGSVRKCALADNGNAKQKAAIRANLTRMTTPLANAAHFVRTRPRFFVGRCYTKG